MFHEHGTFFLFYSCFSPYNYLFMLHLKIVLVKDFGNSFQKINI